MKNRLWIYILFLLLVMPSEMQAQRWRLQRYEASLGLGTTHSFMDIGSESYGLKAFQFAGTRPNASFSASFKIIEDLSAKLDLSYIQFSGVDNDNRLTVTSFVSNAFEPKLTVEYNILGGGKTFGSTATFDRRGMVNDYNTFYLYAFAGVGGLLSKAKAFDENREILLNATYFDTNMHFGVVFPMGIGAKYSINSNWSVGIEIGGRFTLTDNIDGYATPFSSYNDRYILTNFKAIYKIRNDRRGVPQFSEYRKR